MPWVQQRHFPCPNAISLTPGRAFALEGRGIWHALSVSAAQQVWGPLRARADLRLALESPPAGPGEEAGRATLEGAWRVRAAGPCLTGVCGI